MTSRKYYEKTLNVKVPKDFDVHHIDCNNKNNDIRNLVAIPKIVHSRYHKAKNGFNSEISEGYINLSFNSCNNGLRYYLNVIEEMDLSLRECFNYISYRDYLLGEKPLCTLTSPKPY